MSLNHIRQCTYWVVFKIVFFYENLWWFLSAKLNGVAVPLTDTPLGGTDDSDEEQVFHHANGGPPGVTHTVRHDDSHHQPLKGVAYSP